jgi:hypothetical protein
MIDVSGCPLLDMTALGTTGLIPDNATTGWEGFVAELGAVLFEGPESGSLAGPERVPSQAVPPVRVAATGAHMRRVKLLSPYTASCAAQSTWSLPSALAYTPPGRRLPQRTSRPIRNWRRPRH